MTSTFPDALSHEAFTPGLARTCDAPPPLLSNIWIKLKAIILIKIDLNLFNYDTKIHTVTRHNISYAILNVSILFGITLLDDDIPVLIYPLNEVIPNPLKRKPKPIATGHPAKSFKNSAWKFVRPPWRVLMRDYDVFIW
jgi:hypothetical protein